MIRKRIEDLTKIIVKPAPRIREMKLFDLDLNEIDDVKEFSLNFDRNWKWAILFIYVTDENGKMVIDKTNESQWKPKVLKKRANFEFMGAD